MNWVKQIVINVLIMADFFCATLIVAIIAQSVPEGSIPPALLLAIWFISFAVGAIVIIIIWRRFARPSGSS